MMTLSGCFVDHTQEFQDPASFQTFTYYDSAFRKAVLQRSKVDDCFLFLFRPFLLPLLVETLGTDGFLIFQVVVKALAWTFLARAMLLLPFFQSMRWVLHCFVLVYFSTTLNYHNWVLTEDLTLSGWVGLFALLIHVLFRNQPLMAPPSTTPLKSSNPESSTLESSTSESSTSESSNLKSSNPESSTLESSTSESSTQKSSIQSNPSFPTQGPPRHWDLVLFNVLAFGLIFIRDSNATLLVFYAAWFYLALQVFVCGKFFCLRYKRVLGHVLLTVSLILISQWSLNYSARYEQFLSSQMDYHLGGEYTDNRLASNIYPRGDREWILENYPAIRDLTWGTIEYRIWQIENVREMWVNYVATHLLEFWSIEFAYLWGVIERYGVIFLAWLACSALLVLLTIRQQARFLWLWSAIVGVLVLDFFVALAGDNPGGFSRHINMVTKLGKLPWDLLSLMGLQMALYLWQRYANASSFSPKKLMGGQAVGLVFIVACSGLLTVEAIFWDRGVGAFYQKDYAAMQTHLDRVIGLHRLLGISSGKVYEWKAQGYRAVQDYDNAFKSFDNAVQAMPHHWYNYVNRGNVSQYHYRQFENAIADYQAALDRDPNDPAQVHWLLAEAYRKNQRPSKAVEAASEAIRLQPRHWDAYLARGRSYLTLGQYKHALADFNTTIAQQHKLEESLDLRGYIYMTVLQRVQEACQDWQQACTLGNCQNYQIAQQQKVCP